VDDGGRRRIVVDKGRLEKLVLDNVGQWWVTSDSEKPS